MRATPSHAFFALALFFFGLVGCYRGPGNEDPHEANDAGVVPWGVALPAGAKTDSTGFSFVTRRDECCGLATDAAFLIPNLHGVRALYFDLRVPADGRGIAITFANGKRVATPPMPNGTQIVRVVIPAGAVDDNGTARVRTTITATPPDTVTPANGPTVMTFFGVTTDRDIVATKEMLPEVVDAK